MESLEDDKRERAVGSLNSDYREQGLLMESLEGVMMEAERWELFGFL